jgi:2-polyprenyl-3-methyl-5-hydroxy-6-metoxy-1,4-benzoquinol methylase
MFHVELMMKKNKSKLLYRVRDHLVSQECFDVYWDEKEQFGWTDFKNTSDLSAYYQSEEYCSHQEQPKTFIQKIYSFARGLMFHYKHNIISPFLFKGASILDVGSGTGDFLSFMNSKGYEVTGVENNPKAILISQKNDIKIHENISKLSDNSFDLITLWHVLEHLPDPEETFKNTFNLLSNSGHLIVAVPNIYSLDKDYYCENWAGFDVPRHLWHFSTPFLINFASKYNFELIRIRPLLLDALYISFLSEKHKGSRFSFIRGMVKGVYFNLRALRSRRYSSLVFVFKKQVV